MPNPDRPSVALVVGASRGIGFALAENLLSSEKYNKVFATYRGRDGGPGLNALAQDFPRKLELLEFDAEEESSYAVLGRTLTQKVSHLDLLISNIGVLGSDEKSQKPRGPERKIAELSKDWLMRSFEINALPFPLLVQALEPLLIQSRSPRLAALSAKVGSLADNRTGGWYSYRSSKAALNMLTLCLSIEFRRLHKESIVVALHPGTTETDMTQEFIASARKKYRVHSPQETAKNLMGVIDNLEPKDSGAFMNWDGSKLAW